MHHKITSGVNIASKKSCEKNECLRSNNRRPFTTESVWPGAPSLPYQLPLTYSSQLPTFLYTSLVKSRSAFSILYWRTHDQQSRWTTPGPSAVCCSITAGPPPSIRLIQLDSWLGPGQNMGAALWDFAALFTYIMKSPCHLFIITTYPLAPFLIYIKWGMFQLHFVQQCISM